MNDSEIIRLFHNRDESALTEIQSQYGALVRHILNGMLVNPQDVEECEQDVYLSLWHSIPPAYPHSLKAYLCKIARNLGCKKVEYLTASKRQPEMLLSLDELADSIADDSAGHFSDAELSDCINSFLSTLKPEQRKIFLLRYWRCMSVTEISEFTGFSHSKIETVLFRLRKKLKEYLIKRGFYYE